MTAPLLLLAAVLGAWELYVVVSAVDPLILPSPVDVASALWDDRGTLWTALGPTALEVAAGLSAALLVGLVLALVLHAMPLAHRAIYPWVVASQTVPFVVIAPLLVFWLGFGLGPNLVIVALICFFPVVVTTVNGLGEVDPDLLKVVRTLGASRWQTLRRVELPSALPALFSGARISVAIAVIAAVLAEQTASSDGIGLLLKLSDAQYDAARSYAALVVLAVFALGLIGALTLIERWAMPWAPRIRRGGSTA